jgi:CheY-like chemotaxis protein
MKKQILVLDDNEDILDVVKEILAYEGFGVTGIGQAALLDEAIRDRRPDLILMDYRLMDGNGGDTCNRLKAAEETRHLPLIIFSAYIHKEEDLQKLNCDAVIAKPFDIKDLVDTINQVLDAV